MLSELIVEGLGVIEHAELGLAPGSSALTGETGTGKTLVVAALGLLLGGRADRSLVRSGAREASVQARFVVPAGHPAAVALAEQGLDEGGPAGGEHEVIAVRTVGSDGKGKARLNGRLVPAGALRAVLGQLVEIAGQHEHYYLADPDRQRELLDAFAGAGELPERVGVAVRAFAAAARHTETLRSSEQQRRNEIEELDSEIAELGGANLEAGEWDALTAEAARLEHAERLATGLQRAAAALHDEGGAGETAAASASELRALETIDSELSILAGRVESAQQELTDVASELSRRVTAPDPQRLIDIRVRLDGLNRLTRKYGTDGAGLIDRLEQARTCLSELEAGEAGLAAFEEQAAEAGRHARELSEELSARRLEAAPLLGRAAEDLLKELALPHARLDVALKPKELYQGGVESVELMVSLNPGEALRPLAKVASGGELSRLALVLYLLTTGKSVRTMVFDEIDAGVGGQAAQSVGRALARLAGISGAQVIVVTHLPQVAAFADAHYRVTKPEVGGRAEARIERVEGEARVEELSRMLAGLPESNRARQHAQELLELAGDAR